ncbi:MAG: efflux RND transporter periplasmic adaptor subunit [Hylemonella sp.]|nr:efflux RND transporter periplasmic adaptor subunit [Hylemonella sp.]MDP1936820.1 efflux RND transporter periplasmic adaptor subunit [Hylemonella sp.]
MKKTYLVAGVAVVALLGAAGWWWLQRGGAPDVQYRLGKIERGPLQSAVSASGAVSPVTQVTVGTQVSGQIKDLFVDFNSEVKAGQLIAVIDPETFEYRVRSAQADVDAARAVVMTAQANVAASRAQVSRAQTDLAEARRTHDRNLMLVSKEFIARSEADKSNALVNTSLEAVKAAEAQLGVTEAQVKSAQATVAQREAALAQARIDLARTRITSPVDGIVIKRAIEKGQTVAASLQSPELFIIAQNLREMQVEASIDEADVGRIRTGQKASFTVDAFPGRTFEGQISQVRKAALNVSNVVTYVAVVTFANPDGRLLPGMTANVRVVTDVRESTLKVPNSALRVRIAGVEPVASAPAATNSEAAGAATTGSAAQNTSQPQAASAAGGPAAEFRNRLVKELQLDAAQTEKVDAIYAEARPKFMQLRELPEVERTKARERITADIRARISELLTAEQKTRYAAMVAEVAGRTVTRGRVHVLDADGKPKALNVRLGISDGSSTELLLAPNSPEAAELKEGAAVITGMVSPGTAGSTRPATTGPRMVF